MRIAIRIFETPGGVMRLAAALLLAMFFGAAGIASAGTPKDILIEVGEHGPNSLDPMAPAANEFSQMVAWHIYDRLVVNGTKTLPNGKVIYDAHNLQPLLAESWDISPDGKTMVFHLRKDAVFHDGRSVTAKDVKWSLDRAIAAGGFPAIQMGAGGMTDPNQFSVVDPYTFKITFDKANKMSLEDLGVPVPNILNSELALEHATDDDPWALEWTRKNDAGGGPFKISDWVSGEKIVFDRFDDWKSGPLPAMRKVVYRQISSAGTRRALLERGDVDISSGLPPKDYAELAASGKFNVTGTLMQNEMLFVDMNVKTPPFDNKKVRQAIAYAIPYDAIFKQALFQRGEPLTGRDPSKPYVTAKWPDASPYDFDIEKAKKLLAEAGYPDGFKTEINLDLSQSTVHEPIAILIQEQLKKINIDVTINKVPGADWFPRLIEKKMAMTINYFYGWLDYPEYFFLWTYNGRPLSLFNTSNYSNDTLDDMIVAAASEKDKTAYTATIAAMKTMVMDDVPRIPIAHLFSDKAMSKDVKGYVYWFHTHVDYRAITK